tara:strand:+ start:1062 stop:1826 length:765 start_codon:yes stop_codon:yes gene_type:complete
MNIVGICRIRNEEGVIENTLKHLEDKIGNIYVYDDFSTDRTVEVCKSAPNVVHIVEGSEWETDPIQRQILEGDQRQLIYDIAKQEKPDWIYYFDADEYADFSTLDFERKDVDGYKMRFFDYYITKEDVDKHYLERRMIGPEYRDILTLFRPNPDIHFISRQPSNVPHTYISGYVKHYGKAISVKQWEDTCDYYINHLHEVQPGNTTIKDKWTKRKGKAIHDITSDFDNFLIEWRDREDQQMILDNSLGQSEISN